jgi:hypothetical protein
MENCRYRASNGADREQSKENTAKVIFPEDFNHGPARV